MSVSLERLGDRWSLLVVRDMMVRGYRTFKEFQESGEGIASNILADRLDRLRAAGIVEIEPDEADGRRFFYRLTEKGIDLAPVVLELLLWAAKWEKTGAPCEVTAQMGGNREAVLEEVRRRWRERDPEPFLRPFGDYDSHISKARCGAPADTHVSKARCGAPADDSHVSEARYGAPADVGRKKKFRKGAKV